MKYQTVTNERDLSLRSKNICRKEYPKVSIVVLNFNGKRYLYRCLSSILRQSFTSFEILFVDNASVDGSVKYVKERFGNESKLRIVVNSCNYGPALGYNTGAKHANSEYIMFLNNDTEVHVECLKELVTVMDNDSTIGAAGCKQLLMDDRARVDDVGGYLDAFGFVYPVCPHHEFDHGQYDKINEVFRYGETALIIRRDLFNRIGGFDSKYFMWHEDNDLCWRVYLAGSRIVSVPTARIYHRVSGAVKKTPKALSQFYNERNRIVTLIKDYSFLSFLKVSFSLAILECAQVFIFVIQNKRDYAVSTLKACRWVIVNFKDVWKRHQATQQIRKTSDREIMRRFVKSRIVTKFNSFQKRSEVVAE